MRYGIFSDIHSNLEALEAVIEAYQKEAIDKYLCIGDIVGYAANPRECIQKVKTVATISIAGNHDWASVDLFSTNYFNPVAQEAILWTKKNLDEPNRYFLECLKLVYKNEDLTLVHGTLNNSEDFNYLTDGYTAWETFRLLETAICFIGHTHIPGIFIEDKNEHIIYYQEDNYIEIKEGNKYIVNVGSVGQPRDGSPAAAYCIYDTKKEVVQIKRINYSIPTTRKKIVEAGLPISLANRLLLGR